MTEIPFEPEPTKPINRDRVKYNYIPSARTRRHFASGKNFTHTGVPTVTVDPVGSSWPVA